MSALLVSGLMLATTIVPGVWNSDFNASTNYAAAHDLPLVMVWGKDGCQYCANLNSALRSTAAGQSWSAQQTAVLCTIDGTSAFKDVEPNIGAKEFTRGVSGVDADYQSRTPYVRFYWSGRKSERFSGQDLPANSESVMSAADLAQLAAEFAEKFEAFLKDIHVSASYASFPFGDYPCDRLEAAAGVTTYVDVPLVRTNATDVAASCTLRFTQGGKTTESAVSWAAGESFKLVRYAPTGFTADTSVTVTLVDATGDTLATRHIWCLAEAENSPKNPYWIGEKTADALDWGEWSMDLDVVTNKVNAWNAAHPGERAYAMMFVGGSTWCPDCAMAEANFFSQQAFKDWASRHKVVFGVLDIPNNPQAANASPSQLRYESSRTSDAFVTLRGTAPADENERYQSGTGYLSRHSVAYADALKVSERNAFLMGHDTRHGGWNRPERANKNRTGVPVLILLRGDGTIAARWNRFSDVGPNAYHDGYLRRFEEMFALVDDIYEETDCDRTTTTRTIASGNTVSDSVSVVDQADVFRIADAAEDLVVRYRVTGDVAVPLKASVIDDKTGTTLASASGDALEGFTLSQKLGTSDYVLRIAPADIADGTYFGYTNDVSTVCGYQVVASSGLSGGEIGFVIATTNVSESCGTVVLPVRRSAGCAGSASVRVCLAARSGEGVAQRTAWTEATLDWADGEDGVKTAVLTIVDDAIVRHDLRLEFSLEDLTGTAEDLTLATDGMVVNVYDDEIFGAAAYRFVDFSATRPIDGYQAGDEVVLMLKSGALPEGVALSASKGALVLSGVVTDAPGSYEAVYTLTRTHGGSVVSTEDVTFGFTVTDYDFAGVIPSLATTRTYDNLSVLETAGDETRVTGLLELTVPPNGALSAKYMAEGATETYASAGWTSFDESAGTLSATLNGAGDTDGAMVVSISAAGGTAALGTLVFDLPAEIWPVGAAAYRGQYAAQMPQTNIVDGLGKDARVGAAYMALRMNDASSVQAGRMLYAGVLPNGRAYYGSRTLVDAEPNGAVLPFYHYSDMKTAGYVFSGGLLIAKNAETTYQTQRWSVMAQWTPVWEIDDGYGHASAFNVFGGYYDSEEIKARFDEDYKGVADKFAFLADTASLVSGRYGVGRTGVCVLTEMTSDNVPQIRGTEENPQAVELSFSPATGVIRGSLYLPFEDEDVAVTYRGIVLPGWQGCGTCSDIVERPWALGACSFSDRTKGIGTYRNNCEIKLDRHE